MGIKCDIAASGSSSGTSCSFIQSDLQTLFGANGLGLTGCTFGECVKQSVIDTLSNSTPNDPSSAGGGGKSLSAGVIAGLAVVGALILAILALLALGCLAQRKARRGKGPLDGGPSVGGVGVQWKDVSYALGRPARRKFFGAKPLLAQSKPPLNGVSGRVGPGNMVAVLGPSGLLFRGAWCFRRFDSIVFRRG